MSNWEKAGVIGVDAGLCWIGDPCYILDDRSERPSDIGKTWVEFCDRLSGREDKCVAQWKHADDYPGLGVTVGTGHGDGCYQVYVRRDGSGRVMAVMVDFEQLAEESQ